MTAPPAVFPRTHKERRLRESWNTRQQGITMNGLIRTTLAALAVAAASMAYASGANAAPAITAVYNDVRSHASLGTKTILVFEPQVVL